MNLADRVAVAIVAASKITGADPLSVARGDLPERHGFAVPRARAYAAAALAKMTDLRGPAIARCVGSRHPLVYMRQVLKELPQTKWWDASAVDKVTVALYEAGARDDRDSPPPLPASRNSGEGEPSETPAYGGGEAGRPFFSPRQAKAYADLAAAVRNTAALPKE